MRQKTVLNEKVILLVDEGQDLPETVLDVLDMYVVHTAPNSCEALNLLEKYSYDLIMLTLCGDGQFYLLKKALKSGLVAVVLTLTPLLPETEKGLGELGSVFFFKNENIMELGEFVEVLKSKNRIYSPVRYQPPKSACSPQPMRSDYYQCRCERNKQWQ